MKNLFLITSRGLTENERPNSLDLVPSSENYQFYANKKDVVSFGNVKILIDGYVVPRIKHYDIYKNYGQHELVYKLFSKYGKEFPLYLKGFFSILVLTEHKLFICNDIHSVKRFYFYSKSNNYFITNNLDFVKSFYSFDINPYAPAIQATLQHFVKGVSMFQGIEYSTPASLLSVDKQIKQTTYWSADLFLNISRNLEDKNSIIETFGTSIGNYLNYLNPRTISATLTGGKDTRSILAALISLGANPHCFTFGYPSGTDVITAKNVANIAKLGFSNHYIHNLNHIEYAKLINKIIGYNNPFIHIHRAHRLDAIIKEKKILGNIDMVFVGAMGGDYIMGEGFNDYIITEFLRKYLTEKIDEDIIIKSILNKHFVRYDDNTIKYIKEYLGSFGLRHSIFNKNVEFNLVHNLIGCTHDIQDISLFMNSSSYVVAPFMDIDVMEALFSSNLSLFSNTRHTKNPFKRLKGGELQCLLIKQFAPILSNINFANQYTTNDVLGNRLKYILKRLYLHAFKIKARPTFTYDKWFTKYISHEIQRLNQALLDLYDLKSMKDSFDNNDHQTHEGYWHKYSNPIMLSLHLQHYENRE